MKRFYKSETDKKIGGVCGGVAEYFNIDPTIVRLLWGILAFAYGTGLIAYLICWAIMPTKSEVEGKNDK